MPLPRPAPAWISTRCAGPRQFLDADGNQGHARFVGLDLVGNADHVLGRRHAFASNPLTR